MPMRAICLRSYILRLYASEGYEPIRAMCYDLRADLAEYKIKNTMTAC